MADWPSPRGRAPDLDEVCRQSQARDRALRGSIDALRAQVTGGPPAGELLTRIDDLAAVVERHLHLGEHLLWPALTALAGAVRQQQPRPPLPFPTMLHPLRLLEDEHGRMRAQVDDLRQAVTSRGRRGGGHAAARAGLAALDAALAEHVRFEHDVVFRLALDLDGRLS